MPRVCCAHCWRVKVERRWRLGSSGEDIGWMALAALGSIPEGAARACL